jgi:hypothetical protein
MGEQNNGKDINKTKSYIQRYFKASERLQEKKQEKEQSAWDLKF